MRGTKKIIKEVQSWVLSIAGAFLIAALINSKVVAKVQVQQSSMENTLFTNQQLVIDKLSYSFTEPKRGDIVIFLEDGQKGNIIDETLRTAGNIIASFSKNDEKTEKASRLVKRVIGVAGDEIDIRDGYVYVNGNKIKESYVKGETFSAGIQLPIKVGENKLFVLGDNRIVSKDSRELGLVDLKQVEGKAVFRVYPFDTIGKIK
jgi:signal peptidase I